MEPGTITIPSKRGVPIKSLTSPAAQLPALIRYQDQTANQLMKNVPRRIPQLVRQYFGYDLMPFQRHMLEEMFKGGRMVRLYPTEHGKSTLGMVVFPVLSLMHDPNAAHILCASNKHDAMSWMYSIALHLEGNDDLLRDYPWLAKPEGKGGVWNKSQLIIAGRSDSNNRNPSVYATGKGDHSLKGRRGKAVFDDLEGLGAVREFEREEMFRWLTQEAWRCMEDPSFKTRPLWCVQGTPFDVDSVYFKLHSQDISMTRQPYKYESGRLIWPAKRQKIREYRSTLTPDQFAIAMELDPSGGGQLLSYEEIQRRTAAKAAQLAVGTYVSLDPASGSKNRRADYAGITVSRIEWLDGETLPRLEVLYAEANKLGVFEQVHRVAELARTHDCPVIFEGNSQQRGTYTSVFERLHPETRTICYITTKEKKTDPILGLSVIRTLIHQGRMHIVEPSGAGTDDGAKALIREIRDLGSGAKDHMCMSLWFVIRHAYEMSRTSHLPHFKPLIRHRIGNVSLRQTVDLRRFKERGWNRPPRPGALHDTNNGELLG